MKGLNKTETPSLLLLCVPCFIQYKFANINMPIG